VHHEAQRHQRDDPHHLAGVRQHPPVRAGRPARQGYRLLDEQLRAWLCQATGYAGISLQPNAGSQGEYAGLLAIKAWHASRGEATATSA
jgi:glycine cleavage system protein P-like pyridoxal-binding family